ncbi:MAG: DUF58 domain-containing protein [Sandaracinaceae bacterium]
MLRRLRNGFPLTALGAGVAGLSAVCMWAGFGEVDLVLLGAGGVGAIAVLLSLVTVLIGTFRVHRALGRIGVTETPLTMECGYPVRTGFQLPSLRLLPGVRVTWRWTEPEANVRVLEDGLFRLEEEITPHVRGWAESVRRRIEVADAFGLAAVALTPEEVRPVRLLPSVGGLKQMHVVRTLSGGSDLTHPDGTPEGERLDIRAYAPGDPIRFVLWSVFARTRELVVRTPEKAISHAQKTMAYLVSGPGDEPAAGAARVAVDVGALGGDWAFGADGVDEPADNKNAALEALAKSASADPAECGKGLAAFVEKASAGDGGRALVFVPGKPGPWLDGLLSAAQSIPRNKMGLAPFEFIVCTDGVGVSKPRSLLRRATEHDGPKDTHDAPVDRDELNRVVSALAKLRARVLIVDRRDGHVTEAGGLR